uniref:Uncharacterized protein n=1 Tax=Avena sativa TaxID=4498 RepID=A0ACD5YEB9_AVESA
MKISKAPVILKKAVTICKSKTGVLASRLLVLASLRRRMATAGMISHKIHALMVATDYARTRGDNCHKVEKMSAVHGGEMVNLSHQLALLDQEGSGASRCHGWTLHPIFNDDGNCCYIEGYEEEDDDEPPVIDMIRSSREAHERLEFNMDDDIDQAAEIFIKRFREQMNKCS